jgi:hypothetical protein
MNRLRLVTDYDAFIHCLSPLLKSYCLLSTDGWGFEVCLTSRLLVTDYDAFIHFRFSFLNLLANAFLFRNGCAVRAAGREGRGLLVLFQQVSVPANHFCGNARAIRFLSTK